MSSPSGHDQRTAISPPAGVRRALLACLGLLLAAGIYLTVVRGDAILLDLAGLGRMFCL